MAIAEGRMPPRFLLWLPLACFVALLVTIATVSILPRDHHLAYAIAEWVEMLVGTVSGVLAFAVAFLWPRVAWPDAPGWSRHKWLAICGLGIWCIFWLIALLARPWSD
jgi:hypothetical protein